MKTLTELREAFWDAHRTFQKHRRKRQNDYHCDIRMAWVDYVDRCARSGEISNTLANRATL